MKHEESCVLYREFSFKALRAYEAVKLFYAYACVANTSTCRQGWSDGFVICFYRTLVHLRSRRSHNRTNIQPHLGGVWSITMVSPLPTMLVSHYQ